MSLIRFSMRCRTNSEAEGAVVTQNITPTAALKASLPFLLLLSFVSCSSYSKAGRLHKEAPELQITLPEKEDYLPASADLQLERKSRDTLMVKDLDGNDVYIMKAVKDELTGEMVATEELQAAVVSARFRNIAERGGRIDLRFQLIVPKEMQDERWQLRLHPDMFIMSDSLRLDDVVITGEAYREIQLKGYERYEAFLSRIVSDSTHFIDAEMLEIFIQRNIPELYAYKTDSSYVSETDFLSKYGVGEQEAMQHYTKRFAKRLNDRRKMQKDNRFRKYVRVPMASEGVRLDTVMRSDSGDFVYEYVQTVRMRPKLRKIDIVLSGEIYEQDRLLYTMPQTSPLTFYVSSVSAFVDPTERYLTKVISRNASLTDEADLDFELGQARINEALGDNADEVSRIKDRIRQLLADDNYILDSVTIAASASPEGDYASNARLSYRRALAASEYFENFINEYKDSLEAERGMFIDMSGSGTPAHPAAEEYGRIDFRAASAGEDWAGLDALVLGDTLMSEQQKFRYFETEKLAGNPDERESLLRGEDSYAHLRLNLYPRLRRVKFRFAMSRKGMIKDTVQTTVLDSAYMRGVSLLKDHEYEKALAFLAPYADYNTAIAYLALNRNFSARSILSQLPETASVNYMLAILYARAGEDELAVQHYLHSCEQDRSYVSRGNLDPEISALINKYNLLLLN